MTTIIEGIYKNGVIRPLENINLEDNTQVVITVKNKSETANGIMKYAGAWRNYKTFNGRTLDNVKEEIYKDRKLSKRKEIEL